MISSSRTQISRASRLITLYNAGLRLRNSDGDDTLSLLHLNASTLATLNSLSRDIPMKESPKWLRWNCGECAFRTAFKKGNIVEE
jgi:hypothetical protein